MKRIMIWVSTACLAAVLSAAPQAQGQNSPQGADRNNDGKCDVCGRSASMIGQGRQGGQGRGMGRGMRGRGMGRGMGQGRGCRNQCPACTTQAAPQQGAPEVKK
jgi:hypothetical protein